MTLAGGGYTPGGPIAFLAAFAGPAGNANAVPLGSTTAPRSKAVPARR